MAKLIMTFDVISVSRKEIKLSGDTNIFYRIYEPNKQMQMKAKKNDVVAVVIDEVEQKSNNSIIIKTNELMTLRELQEVKF